MSVTYTWSQKPLKTLLSGSNPDRDREHRYLYRTLWDGATINLVAFEWHNGAQTTKIRLSSYTAPSRKAVTYQIGDWIWIDGYGEYEITDTDYNKNLWITADYNEVAAIAVGTKVFRTRSWRVTEPGTDRFGYADTTASIETNAAMSTYVQTDYEPTFIPSLKDSYLDFLRYTFITGSEAVMRWDFQDNRFSGSVAFVSSDTSAPVFAIGDQVVIQQQQTGWNYTDNTYVNGYLAFTGSTAAPFPANSPIYVVGQTSQSAYNGNTSVQYTSSGLLVTNKTWLTDTGVDAGTIYGYARPEYNRVATIINSYVSASMRWVVTDIPWAGDSAVIGGQMLSANNTRKSTWSAIDTGSQYQLMRGQSDYDAADFVVTAVAGQTNRPASIIATASAGYQHPVQLTDSGYLLLVPSEAYDNAGAEFGLKLNLYNATGSAAGGTALGPYSFGATPETAIAIPYGLKDWETLTATTLATTNVASYTIEIYEEVSGDVISDPISFRVTEECIGLEPYCVMWRDSMNSITSFPFQYVSTIADEFSRAFWNPYADVTATLNTNTQTKWKLNSAFIRNVDEDRVIRDLLGSTEVWIKTATEIIPVNITTSEYNYGNRAYADLPNVTLDLVKRSVTSRI